MRERSDPNQTLLTEGREGNEDDEPVLCGLGGLLFKSESDRILRSLL